MSSEQYYSCDGVSFTLCHRCISHSLYATVAYPDMQRWHKVNDTPSQNCIGSRVRIPQFDSAQKTQTGVVTGSKPTLAFTCYPPVPKPDASPHDPGMQFCDGVSFTLCHRCISGYATVAIKVNDTPSHVCVYSSRSLQICPLLNRTHSGSRC